MSIISAQGYIGDTKVILGTLNIPAKQVGDAAFTITTPTSVSPGAWTLTSSDPTVLSISGTTATVGTAGTATVTAAQEWLPFYQSQTISTSISVASAATDPYYNSTVMLMGGEPRGGTDYATFIDSAGVSNPTRGGFAGQSGKGPNASFAGAMNVNATSDYISTASIALGSSDFSIETWINPTAGTSILTLFSSATAELGSASFVVWYNGTANTIIFNSASVLITGSVSSLIGVWTHVALTRIGNVFTLYANGSNIGSVTIARTFTGSTIQINRGYGGAISGFVGYYANTRVVVGSSAYTGNFTKPTTPVTAITNTRWLLNYGNAVVVDKSAKGYGLVPNGTQSISTTVVKYGSGSVYFNGATSYVVTPTTTPQWNWAATGYTIEAWLYPTALGSTVRPIVSQSTGASNYWELIFNTLGQLQFRYWTGAARTLIDTGTIMSLNTWSHMALTFDGTNIRIFVDGTLRTTVAYIAAQVATLTPLNIGSSISGLEGTSMAYYAGYMDDFRMTSVCRYTANFTPLPYAAPSA
jgi:hypothetical protein